MKNDYKNILNNLNKEIEPEKLLEYLDNHMTQQEKNEFEKSLIDDEFAGDAAEGLDQIKDKASISALVEKMNRNLNSELKRKNKNKQIQLSPTIYFAILLIFLIAIITYVVIKRL